MSKSFKTNRTRFKIGVFIFASGFCGLFFVSSAYGAEHAVRSECSSFNGDGTTWACASEAGGVGAYNAIPDSLIRNDTYYIADGSYGQSVFDDGGGGAMSYITIKKATVSDHGAIETGWDDAYGDGQAVFARIVFNTGFYSFDGVTGGGVGSWTSGFGFKINGVSQDSESLVNFGLNGAYNNISHVDIGNENGIDAACDRALYSPLWADFNSVSYSYIHDIGDVGISITNGNGWTIEYSRLDRLLSASCDGGVGHVSGIELNASVSAGISNFNLRHSMLSNMRSDGWIGVYDTGTGYADGLNIYGNIFFNTADFLGTWVNGVVYHGSENSQSVKNVKMYNNTFANLNSSAVIGLVGDDLPESTGNEFIDNLVYNVAGTPTYTAIPKDYNASDEAMSGDSHLQSLGSDPFTDSAADNFTLSAPTLSGMSLSPMFFDFDLTGEIRGVDEVWDRGAFEYRFDETPPAAPAGLAVV